MWIIVTNYALKLLIFSIDFLNFQINVNVLNGRMHIDSISFLLECNNKSL